MLDAYDTILWDWNGTLLNDVDLSISAANRLLAEQELPLIDAAAHRRRFNFPIRDYYVALGFDLTGNTFETLSQRFMADYDARWSEAALHPEAVRVLASLKQAGKQQAVLSAYEHSRLLRVLEYFDVARYFDDAQGIAHIRATSKQAEGAMLVERLAADPARTVLVGDTTHDAEVADTLGVACILVAHGHQDEARLADANKPTVDGLATLLAS